MAQYYQAGVNGVIEDAFRAVDIAAADVFNKLGIEYGEKFPYENAIYQVVRAQETLAKGDLVKLNIGTATRLGTVTNTVAPSAAAIVSSFNLVTGDVTNPSKSVPSFLFITSGTGLGQRRRILNNTGSTSSPANYLTVAERFDSLNLAATSAPDAFTTVPANADGLSIIAPFEVIKTASVYDNVQGVAMGAATAGNWTVICVAGLALVKCVGSTDALVAYSPIVASATAGTAKGRMAVPGTATLAMQEAGAAIGWAVDAYAGASALRHVWLSGCSAI